MNIVAPRPCSIDWLVRAMQIVNAAPSAPVMNHLRPLIDHPPSTFRASVRSIDGSDPAPGAGSVMAKHDRMSPAARGRKYRSW
jgi:hypothetical protein